MLTKNLSRELIISEGNKEYFLVPVGLGESHYPEGHPNHKCHICILEEGLPSRFVSIMYVLENTSQFPMAVKNLVTKMVKKFYGLD